MQREGGRCLCCGGAGYEAHHRRGRRVKDAHTHCLCNLVLLCGTCHRWAHEHPVQAKAQGFVVARHMDEPEEVLVRSLDSWLSLLCSGLPWLLLDDEVEMWAGAPRLSLQARRGRSSAL